ncbi:glycoprotein-N-acetylgalactosamine 3-beta-galactosyltransferase 1 [Drosophila sulfurigaster albostrigata]|uniref:glycoprotein-N-acetylgalactosamine 3-beta-galactosyltransferase 1 n=1 Tax=Drosophila sulfurigaster albostrigata TaxID=89887 RepID=UPI002D21E124|nr:glycoprotein-N-acetylgalactosamine 3-beta-galactosyltransferase 1 [Drosophila sulfurigaster albostrigata]
MTTAKGKTMTKFAWQLRSQLHLLTGFIAGFVCAFVLLLHIYDVRNGINCSTTTAISSSSSIRSFIGTSAASMSLAQFETELQWKVASARVLCMVLTCPEYVERYAQHVYATWGRRCTKLVFVSSEDYEPLGVVQVVDADGGSYDDLWNKTREGFRHVWQEYGEEYDWFLKADDDTYVIMENLHHMLSAYDANMPLYFGYQMRRYNVSYMSGGASYVLSREALRRFMKQAYGFDQICPEARKMGIEDFYMGICLQNVGVHLIDSTRAMADDDKPKFFPLNVESFLYNGNESIPTWLHEMSVSEIDTGLNCCSNYSIAFHYTKPERMYLYEFLLYHLRVFGKKWSAEQLPRRWTFSEMVEMFPLENNSEILDLRQMSEKPDNF